MTDAEGRRTRRWIDVAVDLCERHNLAEDYAVPGWIFDLVVVLQDANDWELSPPQDTVEAHGQLLDLRERYMPFRTDLEAPEEPEPEHPSRFCKCGREIRGPQRRECPGWRKAKRLIRAAQADLAS
jgi:hypothetical protein